MASAPNTTDRPKPASLTAANPQERFQARRMEGDCKGHSPVYAPPWHGLSLEHAPHTLGHAGRMAG